MPDGRAQGAAAADFGQLPGSPRVREPLVTPRTGEEQRHPPRSTAHLWYFPEGDRRDWVGIAGSRAVLSDAELRRNARFHFEEDRRRDLATRVLVRETLSRYWPVAPAAWRFRVGESGKPEVAWPAEAGFLRFNLSHTAGLVVCIVAANRDVGIDVEDLERSLKIDAIARRFFSQPENRALARLPAPSRRLRFFQYWTLKEAYLKARGVGISEALDTFYFRTRERPIRLAGCDGRADPDQWHFELHRPTRRHVLSLALRRRPGERDPHVSFYRWRPGGRGEGGDDEGRAADPVRSGIDDEREPPREGRAGGLEP